MSLRITAGAAFCLVILMVAACDSGSPGAAAGDLDNGLVSATPSDATDLGPARGELVIGDNDMKTLTALLSLTSCYGVPYGHWIYNCPGIPFRFLNV